MKKILISSLIIMVIGCIIYLIVASIPKEINSKITGVKFVLSKDKREIERILDISIIGKFSKQLFGDRTFRGTIEIEGEEIPVPLDQRNLVVTFDSDFVSSIEYVYNLNGKEKVFSHGKLFTDDGFSKISILIYDWDQTNSSGSWSADHSEVYAAPALNREEAVSIFNTLMNKYNDKNSNK